MLFFGKSFIIWNTRWGTLLTDSYQGSTSTGEKSTWILRCCPIPEHMIYIAETWWTKTNGCREQDFMWSSKGRDSDPISPSASLANSLSVFIRCLTFIVALINIIYLIFTIANEPTVTYKGLKLKLNWSKLAKWVFCKNLIRVTTKKLVNEATQDQVCWEHLQCQCGWFFWRPGCSQKVLFRNFTLQLPFRLEFRPFDIGHWRAKFEQCDSRAQCHSIRDCTGPTLKWDSSFCFCLTCSFKITWFCGTSEACRTLGHPGSVQLAISNIERDFIVVGVLEEVKKQHNPYQLCDLDHRWRRR